MGLNSKKKLQQQQLKKMDHSLHHIKGLIILDNEGKRMFAKFYDPSINHEQQLSLEKSFYAKTAKYQNQNTDGN